MKGESSNTISFHLNLILKGKMKGGSSSTISFSISIDFERENERRELQYDFLSF